MYFHIPVQDIVFILQFIKQCKKIYKQKCEIVHSAEKPYRYGNTSIYDVASKYSEYLFFPRHVYNC